MCIQSNGNGSNACFPEIMQHGKVKKQGCYGIGEVGYHLGGTVCTDVCQNRGIKGRLHKVQTAVSIQREEDKPKDCRDAVADGRSISGTLYTQRDDNDKQKVEKDIGNSGKDSNDQAKMRFAGCDKEGLEQKLKHSKRREQHQGIQIVVAVRAIFGDLEIYVLPIVGIRDKNESTLSCCTKTE